MHGRSVGDSRFYARSGPFSVAEVAATAGGTALPCDRMLAGIAPLHAAQPDEVSFLDNRKYAAALDATAAGAVIVHPDMSDRVPPGASAIVVKATYEGWARVAAMFHPVAAGTPGIHPTALVAPTAVVDPTAEIGAFASIEEDARIGPGCRIGRYASVGIGVVIGRDCRIGTHVSVSHALLGARVCLHPGVRIGQEGFSFAHTANGFLTIPQLGRVIIEDDVEIGANSTVDRGSVQDTVIGAGSRLDNLVQIGHNVRLGRCCVIVAQVGISGSTVLEDFVQVGGQAAMAGHLHIGRGAQIGAQAGVIADVPAGAIQLGSPSQSRQAFFRQVATLKRLAARKAGRPDGDGPLSGQPPVTATPFPGGKTQLRGLMIVTVVMGVMILFGTAALIAVIVHRLGTAVPATPPLVLDEPAGTHIAGLAATGDRLAVHLEGGGPDRILLIDPHTGAVVGRLSLPR